jgi:hypothetical protein
VEKEFLRARLVASASREFVLAEFFGCGNNSLPSIKGEDLLTQFIVYTYVTSRGVCVEERARESTWVESLRQCKPCDFLRENFVI